MTKIITLIFCGLLFCCVSTVSAQGIYVEFTSSGAGSTPVTGEFKLTSMQYGISAPVSVTTSGAPSSGKASFSSITLTKMVDLSSVSLQKQLLRGKSYSRIRINFYRTGANGVRELVYRIALGTALISKYSASASEVCLEGCPGIDESITIEYVQLATADYTQSPTAISTWNSATNNETVDSSLLN